MIDVRNVPRNVSIGGARLRLEHGRSRAPSIEIRCLSAETMPKVETGAHNSDIEVRSQASAPSTCGIVPADTYRGTSPIRNAQPPRTTIGPWA